MRNQQVRRREQAARMIKVARDALITQKRAAAPHIDPAYIPSSEPWAPQPWSVETLRTSLASAHLPEEKSAVSTIVLTYLSTNLSPCNQF